MKRWRIAAAAIVVVWLVAAALSVSIGYVDAKRGREALTHVQSATSDSGLSSGTVDANLALAAKRLRSAHRYLSNPVMQPFRLLPFVGRQLSSAQALTGTGATASKVASDAFGQARSLTGSVKEDRAGALVKLSAIANDSQKKLKKLDFGPDHHLIGPLAKAHSQVVKQVTSARDTLTKAAAGARAMGSLMSGTHRYLLIAANNGEMRSGSGILLSAGTLETADGKLKVTPMKTAGDIVPPISQVPWPQELNDRWGWLGNQNDMANLMMSPRFDVSAPLAKNIWEKDGNPPVDGVMVIDPITLRALLSATGPIKSSGVTYSAANVVSQLMYDQYKGFPGGPTAQAARREGLAGVASEAFGAISNGSGDTVTLGRELGKAAAGRHILVWSTDSATDADWQAAGVGGILSGNDMLLSLDNLGVNKLDQFTKVNATLAGVTGPSGYDMSLAVKIKNDMPADAPFYVAGPSPLSQRVRGEYAGVLTVNLPSDASDMRFDGNLPLAASGRDGPGQVVSTQIDIKAGETKTYVLRFSRRATARFIQIEPSARIPATSWRYRDQTWSDDHAHVILH